MDDAFDRLKLVPGVVLCKSAGTIPKKLYDVQFFESTDVHPKSAINFLPEGTNCKYYGQVSGRATYHSDVEETVISSHVADVCGVPQQWGGPKFRTGWPFQASLQYSTKPSIGIEGSLLEKAIQDYLHPILEMLDEIPELKADVRPLTEMETVCGRDGVRFIDKMPPSTSIGFPLSGPKSNFLTLLDPKDHPTHQCPAELSPMFWNHAAEMERLYLQGERAYPIFKACLKDEPTKLTKDKVRVFQGAPCALQLLIRKYYLPVARILSMQPLLSECAVGINAQGPEWDQLARHVMKYGKERILAGDYSKYDLRMPAQVMFAAFRIMMDIARHSGNYSERDLCVMEGIATDVCYPLMAYNGDLIQHYGSNPSGQNLTVYINSIVNALLFRCAFYHVIKDRANVPEFRDVCALITYGDDAKSSVHEDFPEFNHISVAQFLADHDMKFTMPDKESEPTPYMSDEDADLLKRKNIFSEDTGVIMGALDEDSIFKSLHATLKSKALTKEQQSMQNIDGALREWFSHGREKYEERRSQMTEVAKRADIIHGCTVVHESYDDRLQKWKERYD
uniref:RNA-dependent RNA polymerase n=1 Tax=Perinereis aibuhitensis marna-like virus 3 TaxID=3237976 RepID=A0AB39A380_9VIRU